MPGKGLEVVLPAHADSSCVPRILARHSRWIEKHLSRMPVFVGGSAPLPPTEHIQIKGGREEVRIVPPTRCKPDCEEGMLRPTLPEAASESALCPGGSAPAHQGSRTGPRAMPLRLLTQPPPLLRELVLPDVPSEEQLQWFRHWVREEARTWLGGMLDELAREHGFSYASMSVRFQKSRWGSCSARGRINVNACLLFLPERLVRYILLHELCHTRQMNHSAAFWRLVFAADPGALAKDRAMGGAWKYVPAWIHVQKQLPAGATALKA